MPGEVDTPALSMNRPVPPPESARSLMFTADDVADAICLIADMPPRACVELVVRPAMPRDTSGEMPPA